MNWLWNTTFIVNYYKFTKTPLCFRKAVMDVVISTSNTLCISFHYPLQESTLILYLFHEVIMNHETVLPVYLTSFRVSELRFWNSSEHLSYFIETLLVRSLIALCEIVKGSQFYFKLVLLAPSFCGEDYLSMIRNLRYHRGQNKNNRYRISESETLHTRARCSQN